MATGTFKLKDFEKRMVSVIESLKKDLSGLRTGRASVNILDPIMVDVYGQKMPLNTVASISVPEPRMVSVQVYDKSSVSSVEKAIRESSLGLNPIVDGQTLRLPIPPLTAERRQDYVKIANSYSEKARIAVRNVRRDGNDLLKRQEKQGEISQDELKKGNIDVQNLTDKIISEIDKLLANKEQDINKV
ncbi:MAG: Ribosome-recycling factor [Hyphomicrobiaceae bacterium hypho_1]